MKGAREYANLFETGQYGRLYIVSHYHARGKTFRIYVLPEGELAIPNGPGPCLNSDAVEVYGIINGYSGWTESYGWIHEGKWQDDFNLLVSQQIFEKNRYKSESELLKLDIIKQEENKKKRLLSTY